VTDDTDQDNIVRLAELMDKGDRWLSEDQIALLFAAAHANDLRYVARWGKWFSYDSARWAEDTTLHAFDMARAMCAEAVGARDSKLAASMTSAKTVAAVTKLAMADRRIAATTEQWDTSAWLLQATTTTYDLRTGLGGTPNALDYIAKQTACDCAPRGAPHPLWTKFLNRVTNSNAELQSFLQRWCGYCCTGFTSEHVFVFAYGTGANGKSTFINTVRGILGDHATIADMSTFLTSNSERHPTDLAKLHGARFVVAIETQKGRRWDETKIKALTGGDKITARFMRQDFFDFTPTFKLFISGNHKPRLTSVDEAIRRRLLLVPFAVQIPLAERDKDLADKLGAEWPAILRWMINGCLEWQRIGLAPPKTVLDATEEYFSDQDTLQQWLDDCTEDGGKFAFTRTADLFASWKTWCEAHNLKPGSEQGFSSALRDKDFPKKRNDAGQMGFRTLVLRT
jgi:putative DNA primase/helicase